MSASLRALLTGAIDYAGLFPPARLPLSAAFENYVRYRESPHSWLLGPLVLPAGKLAELAPLVERSPVENVPLSVLAGLPAEANDWTPFEEDLIAAERAIERCAPRVSVPVLEARVPEWLFQSAESEPLDAHLAELANRLADHHLTDVSVFCELSLQGPWRANLARLVEALARQKDGTPSRIEFGLKLRCGGLAPGDFPSVEQVAAVIAACRERRLRWKATAGLHHPLRSYRDEVAAEMHGFLNLFVAAVLAHAAGLEEAQLARVLADGQPRTLAFTEEGLQWNEHTACTAQIEDARRAGFASFGSCSFDEPCEDLARLGLL